MYYLIIFPEKKGWTKQEINNLAGEFTNADMPFNGQVIDIYDERVMISYIDEDFIPDFKELMKELGFTITTSFEELPRLLAH